MSVARVLIATLILLGSDVAVAASEDMAPQDLGKYGPIAGEILCAFLPSTCACISSRGAGSQSV